MPHTLDFGKDIVVDANTRSALKELLRSGKINFRRKTTVTVPQMREALTLCFNSGRPVVIHPGCDPCILVEGVTDATRSGDRASGGGS